MTKLREKCSDLWNELRIDGVNTSRIDVRPHVDKLEQFARDVRNEALDEAAETAKTYMKRCADMSIKASEEGKPYKVTYSTATLLAFEISALKEKQS